MPKETLDIDDGNFYIPRFKKLTLIGVFPVLSLRGVPFDRLRTSFAEVCLLGSQSPVVTAEIASSQKTLLAITGRWHWGQTLNKMIFEISCYLK
jgi:hypothetical protein